MSLNDESLGSSQVWRASKNVAPYWASLFVEASRGNGSARAYLEHYIMEIRRTRTYMRGYSNAFELVLNGERDIQNILAKCSLTGPEEYIIKTAIEALKDPNYTPKPFPGLTERRRRQQEVWGGDWFTIKPLKEGGNEVDFYLEDGTHIHASPTGYTETSPGKGRRTLGVFKPLVRVLRRIIHKE